jgi:hypothetical protein
MPTLRADNDSFVATPVYRRFNRNECAAFEEWLDARICAAPLVIHEPRDVLLDPRGRVQGEYRFTADALARFCMRLAPGLSAYVRNVAGLVADADCGPETSVRAAVRAINETIVLRFHSSLAGLGLIVNTRDRVVEGIVGRAYRLFSNREAYDWLKVQARACDVPFHFHSAVVAGRSLTVRLCSDDHLFSLPTPVGKREPFFGGWYLRNSETADSYLAATTGLIRGWSGGMSLTPITATRRVKHSRGQRFVSGLEGLEQTMTALYRDLFELEPQLQALTQTPLGLGTLNHVATVQRLATQLQERARVSLPVANEVLTTALMLGSYKVNRLTLPSCLTPGEASSDVLELLAARTAFDLYNALLSFSLTQCLKIEETLAQTAHELLLGSFSLTQQGIDNDEISRGPVYDGETGEGLRGDASGGAASLS